MTPEEAQMRGHSVTLMNPEAKAPPKLNIMLDGLIELIREEVSKIQPDYEALTEAVKALNFTGYAELIEAVKAIDVTGGSVDLGSIQMPAPQVSVTVEKDENLAAVIASAISSSRQKQRIVSADVEHEIVRDVPMLKRIMFNYD